MEWWFQPFDQVGLRFSAIIVSVTFQRCIWMECSWLEKPSIGRGGKHELCHGKTVE